MIYSFLFGICVRYTESSHFKINHHKFGIEKFRVFQLFSFHLSNVGFDVGIRKRLEFVPKMPSKSNSYSLNIYYSHSDYFFFISSKLKTTAYWPAFQQSNRKKIRKFGFLNLTFRIFTYFKASHFPCEKSKQIFMFVRLLMNV